MLKNNPTVGLEKHRSLADFFVKGEVSLRFWETAATGLSLVNSFIILTALSIYQFGLYQLVLAFLAIVSSLNFKLFDGMVAIEMRHFFNNKKITSAKRIFKEYAVIKIFLSVLLATVVFFGAGIIAGRYGTDIGLFIKIVSVLLIIEALISIETVFFKSMFSFTYFGIPFAREFVKLVLLVSFVFFGQLGIANILSIHVLGWLGALSLTLFFFIKQYRSVFKNIVSVPKFLLGKIFKKDGIWISLRFGFSRITQNVTPWLVKLFINTEAVAVYSLSINLVSLLQEIFPVNMFPWIFLAKIDKKKEMRRIFNRSVKYVIWFGSILLLAGFIFFPIIINLILPKYNLAMPLFRVMLLVLPLFGFYKLLKGSLTALREYKILAIRVIIETIVIVGTLVIFLPTIGILGVAISYIITYVARLVFLYPALVRAHPHLKIKPKKFFIFDSYDRDFIKKFSRQIFGFISRRSM